MIVYLHGFNSRGDFYNDKVVALSKISEVQPISYDSFDSRDNIIKYLIAQCKDIEDPIFVGTSLGAYYASILARHFSAPSILINPCINPTETLSDFVNQKILNFKLYEKRVLSIENWLSYENQPLLNEGEKYEFKPLILLAKDDELIDFKQSQIYFGDFDIYVTEGGGHRFESFDEVFNAVSFYVSSVNIATDLN